jgi:hypothetical protein
MFYLIDFGAIFVSEPGYDLAKIYGEIADKLPEACLRYEQSFGMPLQHDDVVMAVLFGHFLNELKRASKGSDPATFERSLVTLESRIAERAKRSLMH